MLPHPPGSGDKEFTDLTQLVQDQLIQLFFQSRHATAAVVEGQLRRQKTIQQQKFQRRPCRRLKGSSRPRGLDQSSSLEDMGEMGEMGAETLVRDGRQRMTPPGTMKEGSPPNERHHKYLNTTNPLRHSHDSRSLTTRSAIDVTEARIKKSATIDSTWGSRKFKRSVSDDLPSVGASDRVSRTCSTEHMTHLSPLSLLPPPPFSFPSPPQAAPSLYHKCHKFEVR